MEKNLYLVNDIYYVVAENYTEVERLFNLKVFSSLYIYKIVKMNNAGLKLII